MAPSTLSPLSPAQEDNSVKYQSIASETDLDISDEPDADWRYNPERINRQYSRQPLAVLARLSNILLTFGSFILGLWWDKVTGNQAKNE